ETLLRQAEQRAARLERRVEEHRASAERLEAHARALDDLARSQQETLRHIQSSVAWSLLERFWTWNARAFPAGTRRRRLYESAKRGAGRLAAGDRAGELIHLICDEPRPGDRVADAVAVRGWCVAPSGIDTVEVLVDGRPLGRALYGQLRGDIVRDFPGYPDSEHSGFLLMWNSRDFADGLHELTVSAVSRDGRRRQVAVPVVLDQSLAKARYRQWIEVNEPTRSELEEMANEAKRFTYRPLISVVAPVYRTPIELLREAVESVRVQAYDHWQLCLADDGSADPELTALLREYAAADPRISVTRLATNSGIAAATNAAL